MGESAESKLGAPLETGMPKSIAASIAVASATIASSVAAKVSKRELNVSKSLQELSTNSPFPGEKPSFITFVMLGVPSETGIPGLVVACIAVASVDPAEEALRRRMTVSTTL